MKIADKQKAIPENWEMVAIGEICDLKNGYAFKPSDWARNGLKIVRIQNLNNPDAPYNHYSGELRDRFIIDSGDLLFAWSGTPGTSFGAHIWHGKKAALNQHIFRVDFDGSAILKAYFMYAINQKLAELIDKAHGGVGLRHVTKGKFEQTEIELPPFPEQHRLVTKIEELFSELDKGIESLKIARAQLKVYRQAVLKHAFEGKLTARWREENKDKLESAGQLLARIQKEREARYQQQLEVWKAAVNAWETEGLSGKKPGKPRRQKDVLSPRGEELQDFPELPSEWKWVKLGELVWSVKDGPHYSPKYSPSGIPFITGGNVRPSSVDFDSAKFITQELHDELTARCKPDKGDLLYTKGGTTGIARVNTYDFEFNVWVHVAILKITESLLPFYLQHALNSPNCYSQSQKYTHGVGNQDLGLTRMINIILPLCSQAEQNQIIELFDRLASEFDEIELIIERELAKSKTLRQSILKKAFSGQLVEQDPNDEPASVLLERIRAEKAQQKARKKTARKRKTATT